jgi:hypothetical protein
MFLFLTQQVFFALFAFFAVEIPSPYDGEYASQGNTPALTRLYGIDKRTAL